MFYLRFIQVILTLFLAVSCGNPAVEEQLTPADPVGLAVEQLTSSSARLSWTAAGDAETYYVFARPEHEAYYVSPAATLPGGSSVYEFTGLTPGVRYYFGVQAVGKGGKTLSKISYSDLTKLMDYEKLPQVENQTPIHLSWQRVATNGIPSAIEVYETTSPLNGRPFHAWYAVADCTGEVEFRVQNPSAKATIDAQAGEDCYVLINGGIYGTKHIGVIIADGVRQPWREVDGRYDAYDGKSYNITRAAFGTDASGHPETHWVSAPTADALYWYDCPLPTVVGEKQLGPASTTFPDTPVAWTPKQAISTGPMLLFAGKCVVDRTTTVAGHYRTNFEAWALDIFPTHPDRTAVGYMADGRIVLFICDGRIAASDGAYVDEVALILQDLGCVGAINLDGGGSTGMVAGGVHLNDLTGGNRAVLSTLGFFKKR